MPDSAVSRAITAIPDEQIRRQERLVHIGETFLEAGIQPFASLIALLTIDFPKHLLHRDRLAVALPLRIQDRGLHGLKTKGKTQKLAHDQPRTGREQRGRVICSADTCPAWCP